MENNNTCSECKKTFKRFKDLRKHAKKFHAGKLEEIAPLKVKSYKFRCTWCKKNFNAKKHLNFHLKTHIIAENSNGENLSDNIMLTIDNIGKKCPLCDYKGKFKVDCYKHFDQVHNIDVNIEKQTFFSSDNFSAWFYKIEKDTQTKFILEKRSESNTKINVNYMCHRSGLFKPRGSGIRCLKTQGSKKINGYCPAGLQVLIDKESGLHKVTYVKSHIGHQNDLFHLFLPQDERVLIAEKIAMKIPFDAILDDMHDSVATSDIQRIHLLTKKDIYNIKSCFNLNFISQRHNDELSVDSRVEEIKSATATNVKKSFSDQKRELIEKIIDTLNSIESKEELLVAAKILSTVEPSVRAVGEEAKISTKKLDKKLKFQKNTETKKFISTRKENKKSVNRIQNPNKKEQEDIAINLLI